MMTSSAQIAPRNARTTADKARMFAVRAEARQDPNIPTSRGSPSSLSSVSS
jgi:hypothetical protein